MNTLQKSMSALLIAGCFLSPAVWAADKAAGEQKAAMCAGCHGAGGKSANAQFPNLAAQQPAYLVNQLKAFKSGSRSGAMMAGMAASLSDDDMANLAAYFADQPAAKAGGDAALAKVGKDKAAMCLGCHGEAGAGNGQFPRLAGQQPDYLVKQLANFKDGSRKASHMQAIAATLSEDDMKALAAYFGSL
ncbi:MAG: c-type cytochrome [Methylococcales bacterium]|nr:c-type cytochrome [Methylococcales bacterium]MDP3839857.1 c-type cytochrome [Methylococcales bacterium]